MTLEEIISSIPIKPYHQEKSGVIYCADCLEVRKHIPFEAVTILTDPPYGIDFKAPGYKEIDQAQYNGMLRAFGKYPRAFISYPEESMKYFVKEWGVPDEVLAWCYNSNISRQFRLINIYGQNIDLSRVKQKCKNPTDKRVNGMVSSYDWFSDIQLVKNISQEKIGHPCPVPKELMARIILLMDESIIMDPFLGSGTTALACKQLGRKFIGIEISKKYCEIAVRRLAQEYLF